MVFFAGDIHGDSSGGGETVRKIPSAGTKIVLEGTLAALLARPSDVEGRDVLDTQQFRRHSISKNSTRSCALFAL